MNSKLLISVLAITAMSALVVPANAATLSLGGSASGNVSANGGSSQGSAGISVGLGIEAGVDAGAPMADGASGTTAEVVTNNEVQASGALDYDVGTIVSLIKRSAWRDGQLAAMSQVQSAAAFNVSDWLATDAEAAADLDAAMGAHAADIASLQAGLAADAALGAWLETEGVSTQSAIAAGLTADGTLAVFFLE